METYKDQYFEGERPLYARRDGLYLERVKIGPGESSIKEGANIEAVNCEFNGKYPFWECDGFVIRDCLFREGARAALWKRPSRWSTPWTIPAAPRPIAWAYCLPR